MTDILVAIILYILYDTNVLNAEETLVAIALYVGIFKLIIPLCGLCAVFGINSIKRHKRLTKTLTESTHSCVNCTKNNKGVKNASKAPTL